jgi:hypothetical protein
VLKDASSTAIYGARGATAWCSSTTKRGRAARTHVTLDASTGTMTPAKKIEMLNGLQFAQMANEGAPTSAAAVLHRRAARRDPERRRGHELAGSGAPELFQQNYNIGVSGGDDATRYLLSGGYFEQGGIVINSGFRRYSGRVNLERNVTKRFLAGTNLTVSNTLNKIQSSDNTLGSSTVMGALWFNPADPVTRPDGTYLFNSTVTWPVENPVANTVGLSQQRTLFNTIGNAFAEYAITDAFRLRTSLGATAIFDRFRGFSPRTIPGGSAAQGNATLNAGESYNIINENTATYRRDVFGSALDLLGGFTVQRARGEGLNANNSRFSNDLLGVYGFGQGATLTNSANYSESALLSYLGRANYNFRDRYLLTVTGRADGSSRFG